jgi:outer membrane lipoprotein LolB
LSPTEQRDRLQLAEKKSLALREGDRIRWTANDKARGLFNSALARVATVESGAIVVETADRQRHEAENAADLTRAVLGYALPVAELANWLLGRSAAGAGQSMKRDAAGRPLHLDAGGWEIAYEYDEPGADALPVRLHVWREDGPDIRLRIEEWKTLP